MRRIFSYSVLIFLGEIVDKINWGLDQLILGVTCGTNEVAVYSFGANYNQCVILFSGAMSSVMLPKISQMVVEKATNRALSAEFIKICRLQLLTLFPIISGFILFGYSFVLWHGGLGLENSYLTALILMLGGAIPLTQSVAISVLKAKQKMRFRTLLTFFVALLNIVVSIPLARALGAVGSAIGTAAALLVANVLILNVYYQKKIGLDIGAYWRMALRTVSTFLLPVALILVLKHLTHFPGLQELFILAPVYCVFYGMTAYFLVMNSYEKEIVRKYIRPIYRIFHRR